MQATTTCPAWCINPHTDNTDLHYQADTLIPTLNGQPIPVSLFDNATLGQFGIYLGSYELTPLDARQLADVLHKLADLAIETAEAVGR